MIKKYYTFSLSIFMLLLIFIPSEAVTMPYEMLVSSRNTHSVKRFNAQTGEYIDDFIEPGSGGLNTTQDLIMAPSGNILVSGRGNTQLLLFDKSSGDFLMPFTSGYNLDNPTKISVGPDGRLYVSQWGTGNSAVARFNSMTGQFIDEFTQNLNLPLGHTWDTAGNLYVACYGSKDIRKFDTSGSFVSIFTQQGYLEGPTNLWFDGKGYLLVIDWVLGKVQKFRASDGIFEGTFVSGLQNAEGYSYGPDSSLYICDWSQNNVKKYSQSGSFMGIFTIGGNLLAPNSILFRPSTVISIENGSIEIPDKFYLEQNYPNPFNPNTKISFSIKYPGTEITESKLVIYDAAGREMEILLNAALARGKYDVEWNAEKYPSGIYFCRLTSGVFSDTKKMMYIK